MSLIAQVSSMFQIYCITCVCAYRKELVAERLARTASEAAYCAPRTVTQTAAYAPPAAQVVSVAYNINSFGFQRIVLCYV